MADDDNDYDDKDDHDHDDKDDDHHSLAAHLNSFPDHHGVSISLDAAVDCFIRLLLIDHQVQGTNVII